MHRHQQAFLDASIATTDKVAHHGYQRFYPWYLSAFRDAPVRLLEIGIDQLGSVHLWRRYFPAGVELHGIDRDEKQFDDPAVQLHTVDQSDRAALRRFAGGTREPFDVIIDDGSHVPDHQLLTLGVLWEVLRPGGVYIIEDIETSYWGRSHLYGYPFDARRRRRNAVRQLAASIDAVNREFLSRRQQRALDRHPLAAVLRDVEMVSFGQNCIILLRKDPASFGTYYDRPYRFTHNVMSRHWVLGPWRRLGREGVMGFAKLVFRKLRGA